VQIWTPEGGSGDLAATSSAQLLASDDEEQQSAATVTFRHVLALQGCRVAVSRGLFPEFGGRY